MKAQCCRTWQETFEQQPAECTFSMAPPPTQKIIKKTLVSETRFPRFVAFILFFFACCWLSWLYLRVGGPAKRSHTGTPGRLKLNVKKALSFGISPVTGHCSTPNQVHMSYHLFTCNLMPCSFVLHEAPPFIIHQPPNKKIGPLSPSVGFSPAPLVLAAHTTPHGQPRTFVEAKSKSNMQALSKQFYHYQNWLCHLLLSYHPILGFYMVVFVSCLIV